MQPYPWKAGGSGVQGQPLLIDFKVGHPGLYKTLCEQQELFWEAAVTFTEGAFTGSVYSLTQHSGIWFLD